MRIQFLISHSLRCVPVILSIYKKNAVYNRHINAQRLLGTLLFSSIIMEMQKHPSHYTMRRVLFLLSGKHMEMQHFTLPTRHVTTQRNTTLHLRSTKRHYTTKRGTFAKLCYTIQRNTITILH